ncbi:hypothetical protein [Butyrivibrio sp. AE2032]|uniref:hypothetical protein n=1 Tax=Butyrivibrio sp. AE2032 TaxID=1458463 RepID=UPI0005551A91|nr:hypothetical protein [Butyrivibrio sp. AE2032]
MVSVYKDLVAIYILTAALLIVGAGVALYYLDGYIWMAVVIIIVTIILFAVLKTLNKKALKRFSGEVFTLYNECHIKQYMDKLDSLMANKNSRANKSAYCYLSALGYEALGDADAAYERAQGITVRSHKSEYIKRMIDYHINKDQFVKAREYMAELTKLVNTSRTTEIYKKSIEQYLQLRDRKMRILKGDYEGAEEFFTEFLAQNEPLFLITRVSISFSLGEVLYLKGDSVRAREYLVFASENGGDTKYKKQADEILAKIG